MPLPTNYLSIDLTAGLKTGQIGCYGLIMSAGALLLDQPLLAP